VVREEGGDGLMWLAVPIMVLFGCNMKLSPGAVADVWVGCEVYVINGINARIDGLRCLLLSRLKTFTTHLSSAMLLLNFVHSQMPRVNGPVYMYMYINGRMVSGVEHGHCTHACAHLGGTGLLGLG
jgi:hypothetical protein